MRTRIICLPPGDTSTNSLRLSRLAFYLRGIDIEGVILPTTDGALNEPDLARFDDGVVQAVAAEFAQDLLADVDLIVMWHESHPVAFDGPVIRLTGRNDTADHRALIRLASLLRNENHRDTASSLAKAEALRERIGSIRPAFVALRPLEEIGFAEGAAVVTPDRSPLDRVPPEVGILVVCATAPERYLDSPNQRAEPLPALLADPRAALIVPIWAYDSLVRRWPDHVDQLIGLPTDSSVPTGNDLRSRFAVATTAPIEISVLLPVAEYFSDEITIMTTGSVPGPDEAWAAALGAIERRGFSVTVTGTAKQRELRRRSGSDWQLPPAQESADFLLVSINPDLVDDLGHHAHFDRALRGAAERAGGTLLSLGSIAMQGSDNHQIPVFSHSTFAFATKQSGVFVEKFTHQLRDAIERILDHYPDIPIRLVMYSAGVAHLIAITQVAAQLDNDRVTFDVNLLRAHNDLLDIEESATMTVEGLLLRLALTAGPGVGVRTLADTEELGDLVEDQFGIRLTHWPMVGVTPLDDDTEPHEPADVIVVCYPATQVIKGLDMFTNFAEAVASGNVDPPLRLVARDTGHQPDWTARLEAAGVHLTTGILTPDEYTEFMTQADIIALPYHRRPFQIQTSGAFADAARLRRPVVATRSTWAGRLVQEHGLGATFAEGDGDGFLAAVEEVATNYSKYHTRMREFAPAWLNDNNADALLEKFLAGATKSPRSQLEDEALSLLRELWSLYERLGRRSRETRVELAERARDQRADARAEIERLTARLETRDRVISRLEERITETRADRDRRLSELREYIAKCEDRVARYRNDLRQQQEQLTAVRRQVTARETRIKDILADYERTKANLETRIETREQTIAHLKDALDDRDARLESTRARYEMRISVLKEGVAQRDAKLAGLNRRTSVRLGNAVRRLWRRRSNSE